MDRVLGGADTLVTSLVLSEAIRKLAQQDELALVLCGKQSIDGDTGQVGPGIAIRFGIAKLTLVDRIDDIDLKSRKLRVRRKLEGRHEIVEAKLPAMISIVREINKPRYPSVPMRLEAEDHILTVWDNKIMKFDPQQIGLKGSPTTVRKIFSPERAKGEILGDGVSDPEGTARILVEKLAQKELLPL